MSHREQIEAFVSDVNKVVDRYRQEFELPLASVVGSLEIIKLSLVKEHMEADDDEETDG